LFTSIKEKGGVRGDVPRRREFNLYPRLFSDEQGQLTVTLKSKVVGVMIFSV
jgi:hypothetical protein